MSHMPSVQFSNSPVLSFAQLDPDLRPPLITRFAGSGFIMEREQM